MMVEQNLVVYRVEGNREVQQHYMYSSTSIHFSQNVSFLHVIVRSPYCAAPCKPTGTPPGDHVVEGVPVIDVR